MAESEKRPGFFARHKGKIALTTTVVAAVAAGPSAYKGLQEHFNPDSQIVAGVAGQVERHTWDKQCQSLVKSICTSYKYNYYSNRKTKCRVFDIVKG